MCLKSFSFLFTVFFLAFSMQVSSTETAPYVELLKEDKFDIRRYSSMILVTASSESESSSFRSLFKYISGENQKEQKISMTAPVFMSKANGDNETMSFVMPGDMSIESTPLPNNENLVVSKTTAQHYAVLRFSGRLTEKNIEKNKKKLDEWLVERDISTTGPYLVAGYNSPFTLPFLRRNEVLAPIQPVTLD